MAGAVAAETYRPLGVDRERIERWTSAWYGSERLGRLCRSADTRVLVAETKGAGLAGMALLRPGEDRDAYLSGLYCRVRSQGLGEALLARALREARAAGSLRVTADVFEVNPRAARFFTERGFIPCGEPREEMHWHDGATLGFPLRRYMFEL